MGVRPAFIRNLFVSSLFIFLGGMLYFGSPVFATGSETYFTDFSAGGASSNSTTGTFNFRLKNNSTGSISGIFEFSDVVQLSNGLYACVDGTGGIWDVANYLTGPSSFNLNPGESYTGTVNYDFPSHYSGTYRGCILYSMVNDGNMGTSARKATFVDFVLSAREIDVTIIANLGSRGNANTANNNGYESKGKLLFYSPGIHNEAMSSGYVIMNSTGFGVLSGVQILAGCYDVVYKGWHHLSSVITNLCINEGDPINFVTNPSLGGVGTFLNGLTWNGGNSYQIAGDMPNAENTYDFIINGTDLSVLYGDSCPYLDRTQNHKNSKCDLNNDGLVDSSDASVILANLYEEDQAYGGGGNFSNFGTVNY